MISTIQSIPHLEKKKTPKKITLPSATICRPLARGYLFKLGLQSLAPPLTCDLTRLSGPQWKPTAKLPTRL